MTNKKMCNLQSTGDILSWKTFEDINFEDMFKNIPSSCDGNNIIAKLEQFINLNNQHDVWTYIDDNVILKFCFRQ